MFGAGSAREDELLLKGLTGAMGTYGGVAGGDTGFFCEGLERVLRKVYLEDDLSVGRLEFVQNAVDALTDNLLCRLVELGFDGQVFGPLL